MGKLRKYLSPDAVRYVVTEVAKRFPVTMTYLVVLAAWLIAMVYADFELKEKVLESVSWPLCEGCLFSLAAYLWCEFLKKRKFSKAAQILIFIVIALDCVSLLIRGGTSGTSEYLGRYAIVTALSAAIIFMPKAPGLNSAQIWHYSLYQVAAISAGIALALILGLAVTLISGSIEALFGFYSWKLFVSFEILFAFLISAVFYLSRIPHRSFFTSSSFDGSRGVGNFSKNVLLPLVLIYSLILYAYAVKILITWSLPTDSISLMVIGLMLVALIMVYGLECYTFGNAAGTVAEKIAFVVRRCLPVCLLPLLGLMTVGVAYRIGEYGLTTSRLYIVTFNLWAYGIVAYMLLKKSANLNIVAGSFAIVFVLVSVFPGGNLNSIATRSVRSEVIRTLNENGVTDLPIPYDSLKSVIRNMPYADARNLASRLEYLDDWLDHSAVKDIVDYNSRFSAWNLLPDTMMTEATVVQLPYRDFDGNVTIPEGYKSLKFTRINDLKGIDVDSVFGAHDALLQPITVTLNDSVCFVVTGINQYDKRVEYSGYEFVK